MATGTVGEMIWHDWRVIPADPERATLVAHLDTQRQHVLGIVDGLDDQSLRRPILPSGWSCLGLIQHLTIDVEGFWFPGVVAADRDAISPVAGTAGAWLVSQEVTASEVIDGYRRSIAVANGVIATTSLDAWPAWWPAERFGDWRLNDLRDIILHVISETACHAGHLDAARELIDGRQWIVNFG